MMKICTTCGIEKEVGEFHKNKTGKFGVRSECKECIKEYLKEYRLENADKIKIYQKEYTKEYRIENAGKKKEYDKKYQDKINEKYHSDPQYRLKRIVRSNLSQAFKLYTKNGKTKSCAEYGIDFAAIYEQVGPKPDGNYHLDHVIPQSVFNYDLPDHIKMANSPQNLRWLEATENLSKNDSIPVDTIGCSLNLHVIANNIGLKFHD